MTEEEAFEAGWNAHEATLIAKSMELKLACQSLLFEILSTIARAIRRK